jgi:zinc protease
MRLVAEVLREPSFPETEFEQLKREQLANIEQNKSEPTQIALTELRPHAQPLSRRATCATSRLPRRTLRT